MVDKFILKTGSSLFPKICRSYFLFTPHGLGDFLDQFELVPLFQLGQLVADLTGGKAALRTQAKTVERDMLFLPHGCGRLQHLCPPDGAIWSLQDPAPPFCHLQHTSEAQSCGSAQRQSGGNFRTERKPSYSSLASTVRRAAATTKCGASTTPPGRMPSTPRSGRRMRQGKTSLFIRA